MEPINSNSSTSLIQPKASAEKQVRDDSEATNQQTAQAPASDNFSSSNPVSELQLQRSQVVVDLGRAQQSGLEATQAFPQTEPSTDRVTNEEQAEALAQQLQQQISEQPSSALDAQANQASRQTTLTLFQQA